MTHPVRFGLIGAGAIAQSHAQAFAGCDEAQLVAIADTRFDAAGALAQRSGCDAHDSYQALLEDCDVDAVIVCTPPSTHPDIAIHFLERGIHVLCEKPFSTDAKGAHAMLDAARDAGVLLTMASKFRYVDDVTQARRFVQNDLLGEVILFENAFTARVDMSNRWNADPLISGGGVLIDNGTHSVDLLRYFLGPLAAVQAVEGKRIQNLAVEDTVRVFVRSATNVMGSIDLSWSINKDLESYLQVFGSRGTLTVGWKESKYRLFDGGGWVVFGKGYDKVQAFRSQLTNFARAIRGQEDLVIQGEDALASVLVVEAAYRSMRNSNWQSVAGKASRKLRALVTAAGGAMKPRLHPTAIIEDGVEIGPDSAIWDNVHIRHHTRIGAECIIGEKTYIAYGVSIGDRVKINAFVYLCNAVTIEDGVMISAGTIFTNDRFPRATTPDLKRLRPSEPDEQTLPTLVRAGATIGAGCTIGNDLCIGRFAMIGMGSLVTKSVADFHLALGHPARSVGCVCRCGQIVLRWEEPARVLEPDRACAACGLRYAVKHGLVTELSVAG